MKICVLSNGHGEDFIAVSLIKAIQNRAQKSAIQCFPLVGTGHAYEAEHIAVELKNPTFPSGGFIRSIGDALKDIRAGLLSHVLRQRSRIKMAVSQADCVIAVGDVFCLWMAAQTGQKVVFLPTAKSDAFMPHTSLEIWMMKRWCSHVFTRDKQTAESLKSRGVSAYFEGNVMMDNLQTTDPIPGLETSIKPIIGILPGSRDEAYKNLEHIIKITDLLGDAFSYVLARSAALEESQLKAIIGNRNIIVTTQFKSVINQSLALIGLSGTGNEQAAYLGKPVFCFEGFGPQTTEKRFLEQQKLMGDFIVYIPSNTPENVSTYIQNYLRSMPQKSQGVPMQSAAEAIVRYLSF